MEIEQFSISLELLRIMFSFVDLLGKPNGTTINESFTLGWELENQNSVVLRFKNEELLDYLILKPNPDPNIKKRIILNGSMSPSELLSFIKENV